MFTPVHIDEQALLQVQKLKKEDSYWVSQPPKRY